MDLFTIAVLWLFFAVVVGFLGRSIGQNGFAWFAVALLFSPIIAGILLLCVPRAKEKREDDAHRLDSISDWLNRRTKGADTGLIQKAAALGPQAGAAPTKVCPYCVQRVPIEALVCRFCAREIDQPDHVETLCREYLQHAVDQKDSADRSWRTSVLFIIAGVGAYWLWSLMTKRCSMCRSRAKRSRSRFVMDESGDCEVATDEA